MPARTGFTHSGAPCSRGISHLASTSPSRLTLPTYQSHVYVVSIIERQEAGVEERHAAEGVSGSGATLAAVVEDAIHQDAESGARAVAHAFHKAHRAPACEVPASKSAFISP
eukprot:scaffold2952_cov312-Pinguiococcus_pyrenoidosus.AAC.7